MKFSTLLALILTAGLAAPPTPALARGGNGGGGGGGSRASASRPAPKARPSPTSRPSHSASSRPASKPSNVSRPAPRPAERPHSGSSTRPASRPGSGANLPSSISNRPSTKPAARPDRPTTRPAPRPDRPDRPDRPSTRPAPRPDRPTTKPAPRPEGGDFIGFKPDSRPSRPTTLPGNAGSPRPDRPTRPVDPGATRPSRPTTLPGNLDNNRPNRPGEGNFNRPNRPDTGFNRPEGGFNRPNRPDTDNRPNRPNRPGNSGNWQENHPEWSGQRPDWGDRWNNNNNFSDNKFNNWQKENNITINNFQNNRTNNWNNINNRYNDRDWHTRYGSDDYWRWRRDVVDYRGGRCHEVWGHCYGYHDRFFNHGWWTSCWWRPVPVVGVIRPVVSPWWWWRPVAWVSIGAFFGSAIASDPVVYDPGTTVIYEGDTIYINGQNAGNATEYRKSTIALATPQVAEIPVPEPPAEEGQPETWLPVGVWALTQQEQGDAVMFFQLSVDKNGLVAGAYKNLMTGEDQPVLGQLDKEKQRLAWHVGENTNTVYETGLSGLTYDATSIFVHFGENQTQTWLLVRLPSPEMPTESVKLPEIKKPAPGAPGK